MTSPETGKTYLIELCSGERRYWRYLGSEQGVAWWQDTETGREFHEASLMYAWTVLSEATPSSQRHQV